MSKGNLVYSTASKGENLSKAGNKKPTTESLGTVTPESTTLKLQYEKKGRGGKGVTLVLELPYNPPHFKRLMKEIKTQLGTGGAFKEQDNGGGITSHLEFQGNWLVQLREMLAKKGFSVKG